MNANGPLFLLCSISNGLRAFAQFAPTNRPTGRLSSPFNWFAIWSKYFHYFKWDGCYICIIYRKVRFCVRFWKIYPSNFHIINVNNLRSSIATELLVCSPFMFLIFLKYRYPLAATVHKCIYLNFIDRVLLFDFHRYYAHADIGTSKDWGIFQLFILLTITLLILDVGLVLFVQF